MTQKRKSGKHSKTIPTKYGPSLIPCAGGYRINLVKDGIRYRRKFKTIKAGTDYLDILYRPAETQRADKDHIVDQIRSYLRWSEIDAQKGASWVSSLRHILGRFADFLRSQSVTSAVAIKPEHFRSYRQHWLQNNKHRSENTWEKYRQGIASFLGWLNRRDPKIKNVAADAEFKRRIQQNPPETLEQDEIKLLLKYFDSRAGTPDWIGTAIRILLYAGIRRSELVALKWADVDLRQQVLRCGTKTKKTRTVPIADALLPYLRSLPRDTTYVFDDGYGKPLYHPKRYYQELQKACAIMGIKRHSIHSLRHTFIRYLLEAGTPINEVAKIAGHEDIRTTMRYAQHFSISRAKDAVNTLPY